MSEEYQNDEMEIDLRELFRALMKRWRVILVSMILGLILAFAATAFLITPKYQSTAMLYVMSTESEKPSVADLQIGLSFAEDVAEIAKSQSVTAEVAQRMQDDTGNAYTSGQIQGMFTVSNEESRLLTIKSVSVDPQEAAMVANTLSEVVIERMIEVTKTECVSLIQRAEPGQNPFSPSMKKNMMIGILAGLFLSAGFFTIRFLLDNTIKTEEEVSRYLELSTLIVLPLDKEKQGKKQRKSGRKGKKELHTFL